MSSGMCYYRFAVPRQAYGKATASLDRALSEAVDLQLLYRPVQVEALINFRGDFFHPGHHCLGRTGDFSTPWTLLFSRVVPVVAGRRADQLQSGDLIRTEHIHDDEQLRVLIFLAFRIGLR